MRQSYIFYKNNSKFKLRQFDCCEHLGDFLNEQHSLNKAIIGVPKGELYEFFLNRDNLQLYINLVSEVFDIKYYISDPEDIKNLDFNGNSIESEDMIYITMEAGKKSNKHIVAGWTCLRYLWYPDYTPIAVFITTLYKLKIFDDIMDIFAIASSYQSETDRALLPVVTMDLPGLLYFRSKEKVLKDLGNNTSFNSIFYKYPVYFNSKITTKGDFFSDSEVIINIKNVLLPLSSGLDILDIPKYIIKDLMIFKNDYLLMKDVYFKIIEALTKDKYTFSQNNPVLLSKELLEKDKSEVTLVAFDPVGSKKTLTIKL